MEEGLKIEKDTLLWLTTLIQYVYKKYLYYVVLSTGRYGGPGGQYVVNRQSGFN